MKYEEYEAKIKNLISNPDTATAAAQDILNDLKADSETFASLQASVTDYEARVRDLQDTNVKLFLRTTGGEPDQDDPEPQPLSFGEKLAQLENGGNNNG